MESRTNNQSIFESSATQKDKVNRFFAGGTVSTLAVFFAGICFMLWIIIMSNKLSYADYTFLAAINSIFWIAIVIISLGLPQALIAYIPDYYLTAQNIAESHIKQALALLFKLDTGYLIVALSIFFLYSFFMNLPLKIGLAILIIILAVYIYVLGQGLNSVVNGYQRLDYVSIANFIFGFTLLLSSLVAIYITGDLLNQFDLVLISGLVGYLTGSMLFLIVAWKYFRRVSQVGFISALLEKNKRYYSKLLFFGGLVIAGNILFTVFGNIDTVLIKFYEINNLLSSDGAAALSNAHLYGNAPLIVIGLTLAIMPALSEAQATGDHTLICEYINLGLKYSLIIIIPFAVGYFVLGAPVVNFLTQNRFRDSALIIIPLFGLAFSFIAILFILMYIFWGIKQPKYPVMVFAISLVTLIIVMTTLTYIYPLYGTALGFLISLIIPAVILLTLLKKKINIQYNTNMVTRPVISAIICVLIIYILPHEGLLSFLMLILYLFIYLIVLCYFGGLDDKDFILIKTLIGKDSETPTILKIFPFIRKKSIIG